jgi:4-hydroxy-tetrahydrodipicolinate synthase
VPAKTALALMGRFPFETRLPMVPLQPENKAKLEAALQKAGLI